MRDSGILRRVNPRPLVQPLEPQPWLARLLVIVVVLVPLPFGSNRPWAWSLLCLVTGGLLVAWGLAGLRAPRFPALMPGWIFPALLLFAAVCIYIWLQTVPGMPPPIASPHWGLVPDHSGGPPLNTISLSPAETTTSLMRLLAYAGVFWLALQVGGRPDDADRVLFAVATVTAFCSVLGLLSYFSGSQTVLWFEKWAHRDSVTGTLTNRNHFATLTGLGLLAGIAYAVRRLRLGGDGPGSGQALIVHRVLNPDAASVVVVASLLINLVALFLSHSRAGITFTLLAVAGFFLGMLWRSRDQRAVVLAALALFALPALVFFILGGQGFLDRLALLLDPHTVEYRFPAYRLVLDAIADRVWLGFGYGTFEDAFRLYREPPLDVYFDRAHSTYLETVLELGLPAAGALFIAVGWLGAGCARALRRQSSAFVFGWAAACASALVALHATVDYSLQIPAVATVYAVLLGLGCAQARRSWSVPPLQGGATRRPCHGQSHAASSGNAAAERPKTVAGPDRPERR